MPLKTKPATIAPVAYYHPEEASLFNQAMAGKSASYAGRILICGRPAGKTLVSEGGLGRLSRMLHPRKHHDWGRARSGYARRNGRS